MNDFQIKMADSLLKYLKSKADWKSNTDDFPYYLRKEFKIERTTQAYREIMSIVDILCRDYKAVEYIDEKKYLLRLTVEGANIVEKEGLVKHTKQKNFAQWFRISAVIFSILASLVVIWEFFWKGFSKILCK